MAVVLLPLYINAKPNVCTVERLFRITHQHFLVPSYLKLEEALTFS